MVSINNNLGIGALKATAKAETAGIQKDDGQVTVKEGALFPQQPDVQEVEYKPYRGDNFGKDAREGKLDDGWYLFKDADGNCWEGHVWTDEDGKKQHSFRRMDYTK